MAFFPVTRYMMGEDDTVKRILTLEELNSIAKERARNSQSNFTEKQVEEEKEEEQEEEEQLAREKRKRKKKIKDKSIEPNDKKRKKRKLEDRSEDKVSNNSKSTMSSKTKHHKNDVILPEEEIQLPKQEVESLKEEIEENPLPLVTRTSSHKHKPSHHYELPDWVNNYTCIEKDILEHSQPLDGFGLNKVITANLIKMGVTKLFPVQCKVIPELMVSCKGPLLTTLSGIAPSDICVCAPTGCGKTLSYVIPVVSALSPMINKQFLRALVVVPSKDLALQVYKVFTVISKRMGLRVGVVCGHSPLHVEQMQLVSVFGSKVDVLVATPGRLVAHLQETPFFSLRHLRYLIIDEADRIFDQSYHNWLYHVFHATTTEDTMTYFDSGMLLTSLIPCLLPSIWRPLHNTNKTRLISSSLPPANPTACAQDIFQPVSPLQKLLFSATLSLNPEHLSLLNLHRPKLFTVTPAVREQLGQTVLPSTLKEYFVQCTLEHKPLALLHLIMTYGYQRMLCFTHSRQSTHRLKLLLEHYKAPVAEISTDLSKEVKSELIKKFTNGQVKVSYYYNHFGGF